MGQVPALPLPEVEPTPAADLMQSARLTPVAYDLAVEEAAQEQAARIMAALPANDSRFPSLEEAIPDFVNPVPEFQAPAAPMSFEAFVTANYPELRSQRVVPRGTSQRVRQAYAQYLQGEQQQAIHAERAQGLALDRANVGLRGQEGVMRQRDSLMQRRQYMAKLLEKPEVRAQYKTVESLVADRMAQGRFDDPLVQQWMRMKGMMGEDLKDAGSEKRIKAEAAKKAVAEIEAGLTDGPGLMALAMLDDPNKFLETRSKKDRPEATTIDELRDEAVAEVRAGKPGVAVDAYIMAKAPGSSRFADKGRSLTAPDRFAEDLSGYLGVGGLVTKARTGVDGWIDAWRDSRILRFRLDEQQRAAVDDTLAELAPTPEEIVKLGPKFQGADGRTYGKGVLSEEEVDMILSMIMPPEELQQRSAPQPAATPIPQAPGFTPPPFLGE